MALIFATALIAGCASQRQRAPVEERTPLGRPAAATPAPAATAPVAVPAETGKPVAANENAGKPGYYTVKPGDTLIRIGLDSGQNWREIQRWNGLDNPNLIEVGQVLRVAPPVAEASVASRPVGVARVDSKPLEAPRAPATQAGVAPVPPAPAVPAAQAPAAGADEDLTFAWPATGSLLGGFDEGRSKGIEIGGKAGDPVLASADGRVVYAGSGLRGYGNLVIIKHNNVFLTAYAHNQTLLVKEDQVVRKGQKIAEMGSTDAERVQLHFEIRRQGKPVDPSRLLPPR